MNNSNLTVAETADGSKTIYNAAVGEFYHSRHGALQESKHVFIKSGLEYLLQKDPSDRVAILEVGFGTGLNFLLSADFCNERRITLDYTGIEGYPLSPEMLQDTGYDEFVEPATWQAFIGVYPQATLSAQSMGDYCRLHIDHTLLNDFTSTKTFDLVYFDAFAAIHQPEMWTDASLERCTRNLRQGGVFVTYAITGNLKRSMKGLGFSIEKAPGAPGKREMLRAIKL